MSANPSAILNREFTQLASLLNGGPRTDFEGTLIEHLRNSIFSDAEGLTLEEQAAVSYSRFRYLHQFVTIGTEDVRDISRRLLTLHELVSIIDGTLAGIMTIHYNLCIGTILHSR